VETGELIGLLIHPVPIHYVAFSPMPNHVATVSLLESALGASLPSGVGPEAGGAEPSFGSLVRVWSLTPAHARAVGDAKELSQAKYREARRHLELLAARKADEEQKGVLSRMEVQDIRERYWKPGQFTYRPPKSAFAEDARVWENKGQWFAAAWRLGLAQPRVSGDPELLARWHTALANAQKQRNEAEAHLLETIRRQQAIADVKASPRSERRPEEIARAASGSSEPLDVNRLQAEVERLLRENEALRECLTEGHAGQRPQTSYGSQIQQMLAPRK
jgi:hypothetical protein